MCGQLDPYGEEIRPAVFDSAERKFPAKFSRPAHRLPNVSWLPCYYPGMAMEADTLYYTLSAMPQVIGAIAAIVFAFTHLRIANLREYLIGDGALVLNRWGEPGYTLLPDEDEDKKQRERLRDAIDRRSLPEIKHVIFLLYENEKSEGHSKKDRPTGLQFVYEDRFCGTYSQITHLKRWTSFFIALAFASIIASIVSLAWTDAIVSVSYYGFKYIVLWLNVAIFIASLALAYIVVRLGLSEKTVHESERQS